MKRVGFIFIIYFSIIYGICTGFKVESYRGFVLILAVFFFLYWNIVSSDFFHEHKLLRPIQYIQYFVFAGYVLAEGRQLLRGGAIVFNYFFDIVNQTFHRRFTYYINVQEETARSDMVIFCIIILALYSGILILSRRHVWLVVLETMPVMFLIMVFAPQAIHADFFLYLAGIFGLYYMEHSKIKMATVMFGTLSLVAIFFEVYPSTEIFGQKMSNIRQGTQVVFEYVNHIINGEQSIFALNFGDLKNESVKQNSSNEKAIVTVKSARDEILLRSYVGESYQDGKWSSKHQSAMNVALLEDQKKIFELNLDRFRPHVETMKITYSNDETILCYPYYTVGRNSDGDIEYFNVGDPSSFLARTQEMLYKIRQQDEYNEKEEDKRYQMEQNKNCKLPSLLQKKLDRVTKQLKADSKTDIDLIQNLSRYMKENYTYTASAGMTPKGEDPADYFLFQSMRGDCSQYASATVLLLRSMGIPARYVEGYRLGDEDLKDATLTNGWMVLHVTAEHAYAWAEVYVKGIGWIPFDSIPRESLVAASDAREINLPSLPRITMSPTELFFVVVRLFLGLCFLCLLRVCIFHQLVRYRKQRMTRNERIQWYGRVWERYSDPYSQDEEKIFIELMIEKARYSNHELSGEEEQIVYQSARRVREEYRRHLPFYMNFFDMFISCKDAL